MLDVVRCGVVLCALLAMYYAVRLTILYTWRRRDRRGYVRSHVAWLTISLATTASVIVVRSLCYITTDEPLHLWDVVFGAQVVAMIMGLRPMWVHAKQRGSRKKIPVGN